MTNQEAIKVLKEQIEIKNDERLEAILKAVKSLEAWDNVIRELEIGGYEDVLEIIDRYISDGGDEPSVTPTERTGHWLYKQGELFPGIKCSECGYEPYFSSKEPLYKFCPNCGCRMVEPKGSEV